MDVYSQDVELRLLSKLLSGLDSRTMIDVGAERGDVADEMLRAGVEVLYAFDPYPDNASALRVRFADDPRVRVYEQAVSDADGSGELHVSASPDGTPPPFGHTLLERSDTDEIAWSDTVTVSRRSLASLLDDGEIPRRTDILKIDTNGHSLAVLRGMGALEADVVMVEHWKDLPRGLGACPWTTEEIVAELRLRGFSHFAFIVHRGEFVTLKWDRGEVERGAVGNLVFLHDRLLDRLVPDVLDYASWLTERAVRVGQAYMRAWNDRLALVDELKQVGDDRLALIEELKQAAEELKQAANDRQALVGELKQAADDRLALVEELHEAATQRLLALEASRARVKSQDIELEALGRQSQ
jgi:FkbM family methyltransferase